MEVVKIVLLLRLPRCEYFPPVALVLSSGRHSIGTVGTVQAKENSKPAQIPTAVDYYNLFVLAVAILPSTAIYPQRLFCHELFVIGQSK